MRRPAWTSGLAEWVRRPWVRIALVLLLGTCLWSATGRRERAVEHSVGEVQPEPRDDVRERAATLLPRIAEVARRLPQRQFHDWDAGQTGPIHADYEAGTTERAGAVQAVGFTAEVRANSPVWLTGTIELDE